MDGITPRPLVVEKYVSAAYPSLENILAEFVEKHSGQAEAACFGIAGPIIDGVVETTNLPWRIEAASVAKLLNVECAHLINDLEANAFGMGALAPEDFAVLHEGVCDRDGNAAIISAGTGLGEAGFSFDGKKHRPYASEGGHCDFAPRTEKDVELWRWLRERKGHVSWESVLSGPGMVNIYQFLGGSTDRSGAAISSAGLDGSDALCVAALDMFVAFYGAEAGNLAMKMKSTYGMFIGGGIAPRILSKLQSPIFLDAFFDKGSMRDLVEAMPIRVSLNDGAALLGAALCAALRTGTVDHPFLS